MDTKTNLRFMFVVLFLCLFSDINICLGANTISANLSLSRGQTIVSAGGVFEFGFFRPGNSSNYYLGVWYQVTPQIVVWVANRENPVSDSISSELKISEGNLVLFNESKFPIWSTKLNSTGSASVQAVLLDSGNLVLTEVSSSSKPLWQSFDHLTDTILPGSKIGYNKITKTSQILTSWKNIEDPAPGLFSLELDPSDSSLNILWNRSRRFWTSGSWNGQSFSLAPEITSPNFKIVSNDSGSYFTYPCSNTFCTPITQFVMDVSGQIKKLLRVVPGGWNVFSSHPTKKCEVYAFCGPYGICTEYSLSSCRCLMGFKPNLLNAWNLGDYSDGCKREIAVQCGGKNHEDGEIERFEKVPSMALPTNESSVLGGDGNITKCQSICLSNCFCTAYAYKNRNCLIWTGDLLNMKNLTIGDSNASTLYFRLATYPNKSSRT